MVLLLRPALLIMNRLKFPQKFLLVSLLFALPLSLTTFCFVHDINEQIDFAAKERQGVLYIRALSSLVEHLQLLRGTTYNQEAGNQEAGALFFVEEAHRVAGLIPLNIQAANAADKSLGKTLTAQALWQTWKADWTRFQQEAPGLTRRQHFERCTLLIAQIIALVSHVGDTSNLILDPDLDSYYLMEITVNRLLSVAESLGVMRGQSADTYFSEEKRLFLLGQATKEWEAIRRGLNVVYGANSSLKNSIEPQTQRLQRAFQDIVDLTEQASANSPLSQADTRQRVHLSAAYAAAIRATFDEHALTFRLLDSLLVRRIQGFEIKRNRILIVTCVTVTMALYFLSGFYLSIRRMVSCLATTTHRMLRGESTELVTLENRDEMAQVAASFNQVCRALQQTATELQSNNDNLEQIVSERTRQMEHQAYHDALTGLPNRLCFLNRLEAALRQARRTPSSLAVLFLDLDNFKTINDSLGHEAGDQMLCAIAERLTECMRSDDTVARLGGDEFTILLPNLKNVEEAVCLAERIVKALHKPIQLATNDLSKNEIFASGSIGIAFTAQADREADSLLRDADTAMYHAKSSGKAGYAVFESTMSDKVVERMQLETALRFALERDEFVVYYQPLVNLETGRLSGAEALIRWNHPQRGLIQPTKFLSIAEDTGLIVPIGYWVLEEACHQTKFWQEQYPSAPEFTINVNVSGRQLMRQDVVERVRTVLENTGLNPALLKLEITESVMMEDIGYTVAQLHGLKALGVKLAMDDFGTGYSSMANLNLFPLDTVKIDRSFVQRLGDQEQASSIVATIVTLARALNLDVTAEGIETTDHISCLQSIGCQTGQGYYFARPMPSASMTERIGSSHVTPIYSQDAANLELIENLLRAV